jgi:hypothetical protein
MIFGGRDVPWNVSTRILNVCKIIFIPKISNAKDMMVYSFLGKFCISFKCIPL